MGVDDDDCDDNDEVRAKVGFEAEGLVDRTRKSLQRCNARGS